MSLSDATLYSLQKSLDLRGLSMTSIPQRAGCKLTLIANQRANITLMDYILSHFTINSIRHLMKIEMQDQVKKDQISPLKSLLFAKQITEPGKVQSLYFYISGVKSCPPIFSVAFLERLLLTPTVKQMVSTHWQMWLIIKCLISLLATSPQQSLVKNVYPIEISFLQGRQLQQREHPIASFLVLQMNKAPLDQMAVLKQPFLKNQRSAR